MFIQHEYPNITIRCLNVLWSTRNFLLWLAVSCCVAYFMGSDRKIRHMKKYSVSSLALLTDDVNKLCQNNMFSVDFPLLQCINHDIQDWMNHNTQESITPYVLYDMIHSGNASDRYWILLCKIRNIVLWSISMSYETGYLIWSFFFSSITGQ